MPASSHRAHERGQVLALFVFAALAMVAMVGVVIDGGNAWAQNRMSQNGTDAAAEAGTTVLARRMAGEAGTDADVRSAVDGLASAMGISVLKAEYTDIDGVPIGTSVGSLGAAAPPSDASGVSVTGRRTFETFVARILGFDTMTSDTGATAIAGEGYAYGTTLLPVTVPVNIVTCDGQNRPVFELPPTPWLGYTYYKVPLCKNGPGNVGWLDWDPPSGGTSELVDVIAGDEPFTTPVPIPSWQFVTETGNVNSKPVEDAMREHDGEIVLIPLFDSTCDTEPVGTLIEGCPEENVGGNGQNQWYHFPEWAMFELCGEGPADCPADHGAFVSGNNSAVCDTGNGATSCLVGRFVSYITYGTVTGPLAPSMSPSSIIVVQLIR